jgi:hypothetical protein
MTLTIEVSGELEAALQAQAYEQGLTAGGVARRVLEQALTPGMEREEAGLSTAGTTGKESPRFCGVGEEPPRYAATLR